MAELARLALAQPELLLGGSAGSGRRRSEREGEGQSSPCLGRSSPVELAGLGAGVGRRSSRGGKGQSFPCLGRSSLAAQRAAGGGQLWTETPQMAMCCSSYLVLLQ